MASAAAQTVDKPEPGSVEAIANATTEPRFLSPWVSYVPDSPDVPSPTDYLGHIVGAPGELTRTARIYGYYRALAAASPRVRVETIGRSEEGREILLVSIADERNLAERDRHRAAMAALADPRRTDGAKAEALITSTRPFYMLHGGLHSTETGTPEMLMELVYRLAVSEAPAIRDIRERVIVLINPVAEPDGRDRIVDWFYRHLKGKTDYDNLPPISPPYWGKYVFHDNNRDGIQRKLALTRATQDAFLRWHPIVVHDLHESIPLLSIWTGTGPYNPNLDPSVSANGTPSPSTRSPRPPRSACRGCGPRASARASRTCSRTRWPSTTTPSAAATRPSATARRRPWSAGSTRSATATRAVPSPSPTGTASCRRRRTSGGRCATTPTTCRPPCSPRCSTRHATRPR